MKPFFLRLILRMCTWLFYRITVYGQHHIPDEGPVLFVSNHLSYGDPVIISACVRRPIRFLAWRDLHDNPRFSWFFNAMRAIPIAPTDRRRDLVTSINRARDALANGEQIGLFAEGEISRIAQLLGFRKGLETIARGLPIAIVPVHLDGLWGSLFSYEGGRFFRKWPRRIPYPVTVSFGSVVPWSTPAYAVRQAVMDMGADAFQKRMADMPSLAVSVLKQARQRWHQPAVDGYTYGELVSAAFLLARRWKQHIHGHGPVGICLKPSYSFAVAQLAVSWMGRTAALLDPTWNEHERHRHCKELNISTVITSIPTLKSAERTVAGCALRFLPTAVAAQAHENRAAIVFANGPVEFSRFNIQASVTGLQEVLPLDSSDHVYANIGVQDPFTLVQAFWWPLIAGAQITYSNNSSTPRGIVVQRSSTTRFSLNQDNSFARFETGGAACVNTADVRYGNEIQVGTKPSSWGRPLPGMSVRIVNPATKELCVPLQPGILEFKGALLGKTKPNRLHGGWFSTGEYATIDENGFVQPCNLSPVTSVPMNAGSAKEAP